MANNNSEVVVSKDEGDNIQQISRLFKRPSLTVKFQKEKKNNTVGREAHNFRNKMKSYFVHK